jgi:hypothetical protein
MATTELGSNANRNLLLVALVVGVIALTLGVIASESISSDFSRLFTGQPTDKAIWLLLGGGILTAVGLIGLARGSR